MALTMTRTRTQTTLTKLATRLAELNSELRFVREAAQALGHDDGTNMPALLRARMEKLEGQRKALCITLLQFNPELDPEAIGEVSSWTKCYGRCRTPKALLGRYLQRLSEEP